MCAKWVRQDAEVGGPGCTARLLSSTSASTDGFCQGDSSQLLPACPLAWLRRSLQASSTRLFFQLTFLCPFMSQEVSKLLEGRAWYPTSKETKKAITLPSLWPRSSLPLPKPPGSGGLTVSTPCPAPALPPTSKVSLLLLGCNPSFFRLQKQSPDPQGFSWGLHETTWASAEFLGERLGRLEFGFFSYVSYCNMTDLYITLI